MKDLTLEEKISLTNRAAAVVTKIFLNYELQDDKKVRLALMEAYKKGCIDTIEFLRDK